MSGQNRTHQYPENWNILRLQSCRDRHTNIPTGRRLSLREPDLPLRPMSISCRPGVALKAGRLISSRHGIRYMEIRAPTWPINKSVRYHTIGGRKHLPLFPDIFPGLLHRI